MPRLFVALRPPPEMRRSLLAAMGGITGARWQDDAQLHLTLRFLGDVDGPMAEDVDGALGAVTGPRPTIALSGTGLLARKGVPHTIWAGVTADAALGTLRARIERALVAAGMPPERRAFQPHITLARLNRSAGPVDIFLQETALLRGPPAALDAFLLYQSHLCRDGAVYEAIARYPLR